MHVLELLRTWLGFISHLSSSFLNSRVDYAGRACTTPCHHVPLRHSPSQALLRNAPNLLPKECRLLNSCRPTPQDLATSSCPPTSHIVYVTSTLTRILTRPISKDYLTNVPLSSLSSSIYHPLSSPLPSLPSQRTARRRVAYLYITPSPGFGHWTMCFSMLGVHMFTCCVQLQCLQRIPRACNLAQRRWLRRDITPVRRPYTAVYGRHFDGMIRGMASPSTVPSTSSFKA